MKKNYSTNENCFCPNCKNYRIQKYGGKIKTKKGFANKYRCGECKKNFNSNSLEKIWLKGDYNADHPFTLFVKSRY